MAAPFLWAAIIFIVYSLPSSDIEYHDPWSFLRFDKLVHASIFALWTLMLAIGFIKQSVFYFIHKNALYVAVILSLLYGGVLEYFQQQWFNSRTSDPSDMIANATGSLIGVFFFRMIYGKVGQYIRQDF